MLHFTNIGPCGLLLASVSIRTLSGTPLLVINSFENRKILAHLFELLLLRSLTHSPVSVIFAEKLSTVL